MTDQQLDYFLEESTVAFLNYFTGYPTEGITALRERMKIMKANRVKPTLEWIGLR